MLYSIIVITFSVFMGRRFQLPFKKLENNIRALMFDDNKSKLVDNFSTEEFQFLQKFILEAYEHREMKDRAKKQLGEITAQVAHDIKSPTAALLVLAQKCTDIAEEDRIALREAAHTIQDIANNVLNQYQLTSESNTAESLKLQDLLVSGLILEVLSEKRLQYKALNIKFEYEFKAEANFAFIRGDQTRVKRSLSNIINNAVDAFQAAAGMVFIALEIAEKNIMISIIDNGKGMSPELVNKIMQAEPVTADKKEGHGIGLQQVRQTLQEYQATMLIESNVGEGTKISLRFPMLKTPAWIADKITLNPSSHVIILDDDSSIHTAWDHRLQEVSAESNLEILHFKEGQEVIDYVAKINEAEKKQLFLLTDYGGTCKIPQTSGFIDLKIMFFRVINSRNAK